jgi:hypothetical protein
MSWPKRRVLSGSVLSRHAAGRETGCKCPVGSLDRHPSACPSLVIAHSGRDSPGFSASCLPRAEPFCVLFSQDPGGCEYSSRTPAVDDSLPVACSMAVSTGHARATRPDCGRRWRCERRRWQPDRAAGFRETCSSTRCTRARLYCRARRSASSLSAGRWVQ